jgi:molybdenum cofactor guanylyltransferase
VDRFAAVADESSPLGVVLAGGAASRLGGSKAIADLAGKPLISYPLAALAAGGLDAIVVAKPTTLLPHLDAVVITEPPEPTHPLLGLVTALDHADGRPIVACPCDTPFLTPALVERLAGSPGTAAIHDGERLHPLLARYEPDDLATLRTGLDSNHSATSVAESLEPVLVEASPQETFNVNTPADLESAAAILAP